MNLLNELRYTLKILLKNYGFTLLCTSVLTVGVGIVLPLYVLVQNLALRTPDFVEGDRFIALRRGYDNLSKYDTFHYQYFKQNSHDFGELHAWRMANFTISDGDYAEAFKSAAVEPGLMQMPQIAPFSGRLFNDSDVLPDAPPVALISYEVWQSYYTARDDILGHRSRINGEARTIIGVMPAGFRFPFAQDVWIPLRLSAAIPAEAEPDLLIVGKLKADATLRQASDNLALLQQSLLASWPDQYPRTTRSSVVPYVKMLDNLGVSSFALWVVFGSLMLLVAFNVGNLFLARGEERVAELSVRSALGASAGRVAWALLLESFVICCLGLAGGWLLSYFALAWIDSYYAAAGSVNNTAYAQLFWWDMALSGELLLLSAAAVSLIWLLSGGLPAWRLGRSNLSELLAGASKGPGDASVTRLSKALVNVQLVLGCVLLTISAAETITIFGATLTTTADAENVYLGSVTFAGNTLPTHAQQLQYLGNLQLTLEESPGVQQVAFASKPPGGGGSRRPYNVEGQPPAMDDNYPLAWLLTTSPGYFDFFGYHLLEGRNFGVNDDAAAQPVIIVDQRFAERHWPNTSALGKRLQLNAPGDATWYTVIGVSTSGTQEGILNPGRQSSPVIYRPISQAVSEVMQAMVRVNAAQQNPAGLFRQAASSVDRDLPIYDPITLRDMEIRNADGLSFNRDLFTAFIFIAFYITAIATYGLAARLAGRRRHETGIRMAVGATRAAAMRTFVKEGCRTLLVGLGVGIVSAITLSYQILQGTGSTGTFGLLLPASLLIAVLLGMLVMLANYFPARRLITMEPADALRHD